MRATWYVLEDGSVVDPADCVHDAMGAGLTHSSGGRVAMSAPDCPKSRSVEIDDKTGAAAQNTQMTAGPGPKAAHKPGYKTREAKAK